MRGDVLLSIDHRAVHARGGSFPVEGGRGAHVAEADPLLSIERRAAHARHRQGIADVPPGAHVRQGDPLLSVERRALHAMKEQASTHVLAALVPALEAPPVLHAVPDVPVDDVVVSLAGPAADSSVPVEAAILAHGDAHVSRRAVLAAKRQNARAVARRRWRLVPVAGAAGAVAAGLAGGGAFALLISHGSGSAQITAGSPVTVGITATTGDADLLPGRAGAASFTLRNTNTSGVTFDQVAPGATVVSDNAALCASSFVSIAPSLPYTMPTAITVNSGGTSGVQRIADLVVLAANAPSSCQGVTFTVTLSLSGQAS
jgi:hypothetical protein